MSIPTLTKTRLVTAVHCWIAATTSTATAVAVAVAVAVAAAVAVARGHKDKDKDKDKALILPPKASSDTEMVPKVASARTREKRQ